MEIPGSHGATLLRDPDPSDSFSLSSDSSSLTSETSTQSGSETASSSPLTSIGEDSTGHPVLRNCLPLRKNVSASTSNVRHLSRQKAFVDPQPPPQEQPTSSSITKPTMGSKMSWKEQEELLKCFSKLREDGTVDLDIDGDVVLPDDVQGTFGVNECDDDSCMRNTGNIGKPLPLHIVILIVGTRGDVQPFVAIGKRLQEYGHRVRLATHKNFEEFVSKAGLEFYPLGGDPKILADYMVKNKGLLPSRLSDLSLQKREIKAIIESLFLACTSPGEAALPFKVQAIIANPPAYGHVDVAEYLKVPLHIFFTMPWTPTTEFAHPLSRVPRRLNTSLNSQLNPNWISYRIVDALIWAGIGNLINKFRRKRLNLPAIHSPRGSLSTASKLPTAYIWSPHLVPKPKDWGSKIDVVGFCFLDLTHDYKPPKNLIEWLAAGSAPVYVGFGSLPVDNAEEITKIIIEALDRTSQRGIISRGWGGIGINMQQSDSIYLMDDCPHDWLFPRCSAVVHHGGAGTTAAGLIAACPTTVIPFFGDQFFWGEQVHARGVGPPPIPSKSFEVDTLVSALNYMLRPEVKRRAEELAAEIKAEDGVGAAVAAFHKQLRSISCGSADISRRNGLFSNALFNISFMH